VFKDVDPKKWYAGVVEEAAKLGLMVGTAPGIFEPDKPTTRAELAAIAVRLYKATNEDFVEVIHNVLPSVVQVENFELGGLGSGTIIHPAGYVLTNCHVISQTTKQSDGNESFVAAKTVGFRTPEAWRYAEGPVLAYDRKRDLALCKIELSEVFPTLPFAAWSKVGQAQKVLAIGSPLGLIRSVSEGVVSAIRDGLYGFPGTLVQTEAEINPGNSGGALVNLAGGLIGVPSMKLVDVAVEGLNFAIGLPTVLAFLEEKAPEILNEIGEAS
jgi:S1-C subfamily serine protease